MRWTLSMASSFLLTVAATTTVGHETQRCGRIAAGRRPAGYPRHRMREMAKDKLRLPDPDAPARHVLLREVLAPDFAACLKESFSWSDQGRHRA